jgi:Pyridoxamine 5'-phosphate oxidase
VHETEEDVLRLEALLSSSFANAGDHLTSIISEQRRLSARDLCRYFVGVRPLVVATTTRLGEPRCSAVDGLLVRGHLWFSTAANSLKVRHLEVRPGLSGAHVIGDDVGVFVHGQARLVQGASEEAALLAPIWRSACGGAPEEWVDDPRDARYVEILPSSMFTFVSNYEQFESMCENPTSEDPR